MFKRSNDSKQSSVSSTTWDYVRNTLRPTILYHAEIYLRSIYSTPVIENINRIGKLPSRGIPVDEIDNSLCVRMSFWIR
jgi:hypothetical protein